MSVSIIIPAFNEAAVIDKTLSGFTELIENSIAQVIVVCNGCTDNTAEVVKKTSDKILCIETPVGSKTNALNLGDAAAHYFPRIYLDADIRITSEGIKVMLKTLQNSQVLATSLLPEMDFSGCSWPVRAFYDVWLRLPYCQAGMIGSGVYALSQKGRARFEKFPAIIADDGYVRCLFSEQERQLTNGHYAMVNAPKDIISLVKIKTRSRLGRYEFQEKFPQLLNNEKKDYSGALLQLLPKVKLWPKIFVYLAVNLISRVRAKAQFKQKFTQWERDESNR